MRRAFHLAAEGMAVFPLQAGSKVPALGRGWRDRATRDPERIRAWWSAAPFNIGVATGGGLVVIDLDAPKESGQPHGWQALMRLAHEREQLMPRATRTVVTPNGGRHLYFRTPLDLKLRNTAGTLALNVDTRAEGGYVVGPGSVVDSRRYRITCPAPPAQLPDWLGELLRPRRSRLPVPSSAVVSTAYIAAAVSGEKDRVAGAVVGTRNTTLFGAAARLGRFVVAGHLSEADVVAALWQACDGFRDFGPREIERTIRSGLSCAARTRGAERPLSPPTATR